MPRTLSTDLTVVSVAPDCNHQSSLVPGLRALARFGSPWSDPGHHRLNGMRVILVVLAEAGAQGRLFDERSDAFYTAANTATG